MRFPEEFTPLIQWSILHLYHMSYVEPMTGNIVIPNCKTCCRLDRWLLSENDDDDDDVMSPETVVVFIQSILKQFDILQMTYADRFHILGFNRSDFYVLNDGESFVYTAPFLPYTTFYSANEIPAQPKYNHPSSNIYRKQLPYVVQDNWWIYAFGELVYDCLGGGVIPHPKLTQFINRCRRSEDPVVYC
jgi:hypothetical protein